MSNELNDSAEPLSADAYLERIDDRINWRLTHVSLPVADVKYLVNTVRALTERAERAEAALLEEPPRWEHDRLVIEKGWNTPDRCAKCGEVNRALFARVTELEQDHADVLESAEAYRANLAAALSDKEETNDN